jgi:hypothetical protein
MKETVWQLTAIDVCSSYAWAELVSCPRGQPSAAQTSKLARRMAAELQAAGWKLERVLSDNSSEFVAASSRRSIGSARGQRGSGRVDRRPTVQQRPDHDPAQ